jgi:hypothetical protein
MAISTMRDLSAKTGCMRANRGGQKLDLPYFTAFHTCMDGHIQNLPKSLR